MVNGRTPVVQTGLEGKNLGELVISVDGDKLKVESYRLHPIDDSIAGDRAIADEIDKLKKSVTTAVFASRGYSIDQPLAIAPQDLPNTFTDIAAGTILANLVTDALKMATKADIGFTANGMMRAPLMRGKMGVLTVYDVFAVAPLGAGVVDTTAGSALVTGYFTGLELKNLLEFFLVDNPAHPGEYFPRVSGMRFRYDKSRPMFDVVTAIELGDLDRGYAAHRHQREGRASVQPHLPADARRDPGGHSQVHEGQAGARRQEQGRVRPLTSRVEALDAPHDNSGYLLAPPGTMDKNSVATGSGNGATREIKEWQAIMDHLRSLPVKNKGELAGDPGR